VGPEKIIVPVETLLFKVSYALVDNILCQSPSIIKFGNLEKYRQKIVFWPGSYIDVKGPIHTMPKNREELIGYGGRLLRFKGVMNLVRAVPLILSRRKDVRFLIAGNGEEEEKIEKQIESGWNCYCTPN
jgi:glycosyltransferase involved in cell wall biosynthesis